MSRGNSNNCMATPMATRDAHQRWSLNVLSTELLILVLKQLGEVDPASLGAVRLVSKRLDASVVPVKYHSMRMTQYVIAPEAEVFFPAGIANICAHTRHVRLDSDLNLEHVRRLLSRMKKLSSISWRYVQGDYRKSNFWVPSDIISPQQLRYVKLYVEDLPLQGFRCKQYNPYLSAIPAEILVSLRMATPTPPLTARLENLKTLLLSSPRLETLRYEDRGQGTQFSFSRDERLPPIKELSLRSYDWNHDSDVVRQHWDFSEIRRLEMVDVPLNQFLNSVSFTDFQHLETLCLDDFSMHLPDRRQDATRSQYILIKQIRALVDLRITCHIQSFPVDGILQHAKSLRNLCFRDYVGFSDEHSRCPTMDIGDLDTMARQLINLHTLELDMDEQLVETNPFLRILCNFRQLHTLTLHTQTILDPFKHTDTSVDPDRARVTQMISLLVKGKQGASFRNIIINVGGWKLIMVRRLSSQWRRQNSRGVYAERCFAMEKGEDGSVAVREELPIGTS
ncbi:F-box domain-containing protein [Xylaria intraflava]|nr:F-box domain-containing protein [Xylaria intraflava]